MSILHLTHTRALAVLSLILLIVLAGAATCLAADPPSVSANSLSSRTLALTVGKSTIVESSDNIRRVSVAAPEIADTVILTTRQIYVTGKASGVTTITIWSDANRIAAVFDVEVGPDVLALRQKIHQMFPEEKNVNAVATNDSITLSGSVSSAAALSQILKLAEAYAPLDKVTQKPKILNLLEASGIQQVMLEAIRRL